MTRRLTSMRIARLATLGFACAVLLPFAGRAQRSVPITVDSTSSSAVFHLAQSREASDRADAIALYRRYVAMEPRDAWGYIALGDALGRSGDVSGALAQYDAAERVAPNERDVHVGRARLLARAGRTDDAIGAYERWLARTSGDTEAWRELATQQRKAGRDDEAIASLQRVRALDSAPKTANLVSRDIERERRAGQGYVEPRVTGSRDSDGLITTGAGLTVTSPLLGRARLSATTATGSAGDGTVSRSSQHVALGVEYRPLAQLRFQLAVGVARADRSLIATGQTPAPVTPTPTPSRPGRGGTAPIGVSPVGTGTNSISESFPVGNARLQWRKPGNAIAMDVRASRQLLDASPYLVAQGVLRDEASLSLDLRLAGPLRVRGFGKLDDIHNADESNGRQVFGGALVVAPSAFELSLRAQTMRYDTATTLAYFAPRSVQTVELGTYFERETDRGVTVAMDLGGGAQQVADWSSAVAAWSPTFHGWTQIVVPLNDALALGTEIEAYDSLIGGEVRGPATPGSRWRYASANLSLRVKF